MRSCIGRARRVEHELDEELAFHIEYETWKPIASGLSAADARARGLARFGPVSLVAERCRDARATALIDEVARDVLYGYRTFRRAPLAAFTIVATVALGLRLVAPSIGASSICCPMDVGSCCWSQGALVPAPIG